MAEYPYDHLDWARRSRWTLKLLIFLFMFSMQLTEITMANKKLKNHTETSTPLNTDLTHSETAVFGAGCFWGVEEIIRKIPGVIDTTVGYCGGTTTDPTYRDITTGTTGHAESIEVRFDPKIVSYETLLDYFFRFHDPTTHYRQGNDIGSQYRSVIFYQNEAQKTLAETKKQAVDASGKWENPVVTEIVSAQPFYSAEDYHQDYLQKNPGGYSCHYLRE